jgi:hypothetical protein
MIGRSTLSFETVETNNKSNVSFISAYFVNTGFLTGEFCVLTRQAELRVNPTFAFNLANFYVGDVCELVCHRNLHPLLVA